MQDEISRMPAEEDGQAEKGVLGLLLASASQQPWSVVEVERELGKRLAIADAITSLHAAGLIHRCGDFVFASRAALSYGQPFPLSGSRGRTGPPGTVAPGR